MPPPRPVRGRVGSAPGRGSLEAPIGIAKLTPKAAAVEAAARELRQVMGRFATGVTVVTTTQRDTIHGMTANAFLSVSLRPPLVLVSLGRCRMSEMLPRTGRYGVSVLASDQEHFAAHFAGQRVSPVAPNSCGTRTCRCSTGRWPTSAAGWWTCTRPGTTCCGSARSSTCTTATASRCCSTPAASGRCARSRTASRAGRKP